MTFHRGGLADLEPGKGGHSRNTEIGQRDAGACESTTVSAGWGRFRFCAKWPGPCLTESVLPGNGGRNLYHENIVRC